MRCGGGEGEGEGEGEPDVAGAGEPDIAGAGDPLIAGAGDIAGAGVGDDCAWAACVPAKTSTTNVKHGMIFLKNFPFGKRNSALSSAVN